MEIVKNFDKVYCAVCGLGTPQQQYKIPEGEFRKCLVCEKIEPILRIPKNVRTVNIPDIEDILHANNLEFLIDDMKSSISKEIEDGELR